MLYTLALLFCFGLSANANGVSVEPPLSCTGNLLTNSGFENGLNNWTDFGAASLSSDAYAGSQSLQLCPVPGSDNRVLQGVSITPGTEYTVTFFGKREMVSGGLSVYVKFLTSSFQPIGTPSYGAITSNDWEAYEKTETAPSNAQYMEVGFDGSADGCVFVDELCLIEGGFSSCSISTQVSAVQCQDNGTPANPADDTFTFQVIVNNSGGCSPGWTGGGMSENYGSGSTFGPYPANGGAVGITFQDNGDPLVTASVSVDPPPACSQPPTVCTGNITLTSQAEVNAWTGCTIVEGDLRIAGNNITDLSPLTTLQKVRGSFSVDDNAILTNLSGLENLDSVGVLVIAENAQLQNINALNLSQTSVVSIILYNNNSLQTVSGLNNFTSADNLEIFLNDNLTSITGFNGLTIVNGNLLIQSNNSLNNLGGFSSLAEITGAFQLISHDALPGINGFGNLSTVVDNFVISSNAGLENINGFTSLANLNLVAIAGNSNLKNLNLFNSFTGIGGDLNILNNAALSNCCGIYPMLNGGGVSGVVSITGNPMGCSNETEILNNCVPSGDIDLELSLAQPNATPSQWSSYEITATLTNTGGQTATGVALSFEKPAGVVYSGGNEWNASQGSFDPFTNEVWNVGNIPAGGSATLTVSYFLLASEAPLAYAQVSAANESDADSTPGNGTCCTPNEDDEANTGGGGPPNLTPDLTVANLNIPNISVEAGDVLSYDFDLSNIGNGAASGNFVVRAYISSDTQISADDVQDGIIQTGNFAAGDVVQDIPGASSIPNGLADGQYYLILKVDADNQVVESNEGNNTISASFSIIGGGGGGGGTSCAFTTYYTPSTLDPLDEGRELLLIENASGYTVSHSNEYNFAFSPYTTNDTYELDLEGNVNSESQSPITSVYDVQVETDADENVTLVFLQSPDLPAGTVVPIDIDYVDPITVLHNVKAIKTSTGYAFGIGIIQLGTPTTVLNRVIQTDNFGENVVISELTDSDFYGGFSAIVEGPDGSIFTEWRTSGNFSLFTVPGDGSAPWQDRVASDTPSASWIETEASQDGNFVYTMKTDNSQVFVSKYDISTGTEVAIDLIDLKTSPFPSGFRSTWARGIEPTADGGLLLSLFANEVFSSDPDSGVMAKYDAAGNLVWQQAIPDSEGFSITPVGETSDGGALFAGGNSSETIFIKTAAGGALTPVCSGGGSGGGGDIDLSLTMNTDNLSSGIYSNSEITLTVTNAGPQAATDVVVDFPKPGNTVYTGGNEWSATQGSFSVFTDEQWTVGNIPAGGSATLTVSYFFLTGNALTPYAQVQSANETDGDSTPGNGTCCTPNEDDEATLTLNAFAGGGSNAFGKLEVTGRPVQLVAVNPNPVYHGQVKVTIDSQEEGTFNLEAFDVLGKQIFLQKIDLQEGRNDVLMDVSQLKSGTYYLNMPGQNWRNMPLRFVVARW